MSLFDILATVGFLLGASGDLLLIVLMRRRGIGRRGERAFLGMVSTGGAFYAAAFASLFLGLLFQSPPRGLCRLFDGVAIVCLSLQPSLLLHSFLEFYFRTELTGWLRAALYVPALTGAGPLLSASSGLFDILARHGTPLFTWYMLATLGSSLLALGLAQKAVERPDRGFARDIGRALGPVWVLMMLTFPAGAAQQAVIGRFMQLACLMAPLVPSIVFGYYIYRYNYMGYFMRNTLVNSMLAFLLLCFYIFGVRQVGDRLLRGTGVNAEILEGLLIMGLVFAFSTLQGASQEIYDRLVMRQSGRKREIFASISAELGSPLATDPGALLTEVAAGVREALSVEWLGIFFLTPEGRVTASSCPPGHLRLELLLEPFSKGRAYPLETDELEEGELKEALVAGEIVTVVPVLSRQGPAGLACLGRRAFNRPITPEELDMVGLILNQLRGAVDKVQIFHQKLALERKLLEDERLASLGLLSASVAHEIKNPLGSMKAIIQVMRETIPTGDLRREDLSVVLEEIDRLAATVTRLLDFIRPREPEERYVAVERVVERVLEIFSYEARRRSVAIVQRLSPEPHYLKGGLDALKSILFNLVLNALQAMERGGTLTIATRSSEEGRVTVEVADTGPGIPEAEIDRIFQPFHSSKKSGTGLGLALVRQRLDELGGSIGVTSDSSGTRFKVELPVYLPANLRMRPAV